jgi:dephospho-CoA kinase
MLKAGLTGGLASGKSLVGKALAELGCLVIEADQIGHEVLAPGGSARDAVLREFGTADRKQLAALVFKDPQRLAALNAIVHPAVYAREDQLMADSRNDIIVVAAAILVETGKWRRFDCLIVAVCTREQQIERAMHRDGATLEDVLARLARQMPLEEKRKYADYVIDTSGTKEDALRQTREVYDCLRNRVEGKTEL